MKVHEICIRTNDCSLISVLFTCWEAGNYYELVITTQRSNVFLCLPHCLEYVYCVENLILEFIHKSYFSFYGAFQIDVQHFPLKLQHGISKVNSWTMLTDNSF
jgi:hypothetical protein